MEDGLVSRANPLGLESDTYFGTKGVSTGTNTGNNYGVLGEAANGSSNYGVYGFLHWD